MHSDSHPRRYHGLDVARGVLMALGVVLHAANVYAQDQTWLIGDTARHPFFDLLSDAIHVFRMPAFFLLSGFFAAMMLERHPPARFLARRLKRLAVPMIAAGVLLNGLQGFFFQSAQDSAQSL